MSRIDPECFSQLNAGDATVCTACFTDRDIKAQIRRNGEPGFCDYCGRNRPSTQLLSEIGEFIAERLSTFYGRAVDQLPYDSREGGFQAWHVDTHDLLFGTVGLELPNDRNERLCYDLIDEIGDDTWCDYDWLTLEYDQSLESSWAMYCEAVKSQRRFFFHRIGEQPGNHPDERSIGQFLYELAGLIDKLGVIETCAPGYTLYRARVRDTRKRFRTASELGPPPSKFATQSNRMNPPGIPMFYGAETKKLAIAENRASKVSIGRFETNQEIRLIDLAFLPSPPGFFSEATRTERQGRAFLDRLSALIAEPVARDDRVHIDYIPTQIIAEFFRDHEFEGGRIDGVRYVSATGQAGANVVLFATQSSLFDGNAANIDSSLRWLRLISVSHKNA